MPETRSRKEPHKSVLGVLHSHPRALTLASSLPTLEFGGWFKFAVTGANARND